MTFTFNGIGTKLYGQCDFAPDGSLQTTKWFVVAYLPIAPLQTMRIREVGGNRYQELAHLPLDGAQVGRVYAFVVACLAWLWVGAQVAGSGLLNRLLDAGLPLQVIAWALIAAFAAAPFLVVWRLRGKARRQRLPAASA